MLFSHTNVDPSSYIKEWIELEKKWNMADGDRMQTGGIKCTMCEKYLKSDSSLVVHTVRFHYDDIEVLLTFLRSMQSPPERNYNTSKKRKLEPRLTLREPQLALPAPSQSPSSAVTQSPPPGDAQSQSGDTQSPKLALPAPGGPPISGDIVAESLSKIFAEVQFLRIELANKDKTIKKLEKLNAGLRTELTEKDKMVSYTSFSMQLQQARQLQ